MATLTSNVSATVRLFLISGDASAARLGKQYRVDDEVVTLRSFQRLDSKGHPSHVGTPNQNRWVVTRGDADSRRATHTAGTELVGVTDAYSVSTTLAPPTPFAGSGDGGVLVDNGVDTPLTVSTIVAPGATLDDATATLSNPDNEVFIDTSFPAVYKFSSNAVPQILSIGSAGAVAVNATGIGYFLVGRDEDSSAVYIQGNGGADLFYIQDGSGDEVIYVKGNGLTELRPVVIGTAAPADNLLSSSQAAIWFDATNGAAKLMVKAKQANGTVVTGSVDLA